MKQLSFVLPCYNVERYVKDCLDSIYRQSLPEELFEIICVNDCSTDATLSILDGYAQKKKNLHIKNHAKNMTVGGARNTGINEAEGEFIWFIDPDDCVRPDIDFGFLDMIVDNIVDILFFNYEIANEGLDYVKTVSVFKDIEVQDGRQFVLNHFSGNLSKLGIVWQCVFRRQFINENSIRFPQMCMGEDNVFLWNALFCAKRVMAVDKVYYKYRQNPYSIGQKRLSPRALFSDRIRMGSEIVSILDNHKDLPDSIVNDLNKSLKWRANCNLFELSFFSIKELSQYYDEIITHADEVAKLYRYMNRKQRVVFDVFGGKALWIVKIRFLSVVEGLRTKG